MPISCREEKALNTGIVVFDMCSSTEIIEGLQSRGRIGLYNELFNHLETLIRTLSQTFGCRIYKFLGDGFILTLNAEASIESVIYLCSIICKIANNLVNTGIIEELNFTPKRTGFTFGFDTGVVYALNMRTGQNLLGR